MYSRILRAALPFLHFVVGKKSWAYLKELERSQWFSPDEIAQIQWKRLKAMLSHAYENVPFYRRRFEESKLTPSDIKAPTDMLKLPLLTRQELRDAINKGVIIASNIGSDRFRKNKTGGSTGKPLTFYNDKIQLEYRWASTNRNLRWTGYNIGDKIVKLWSDAQYLGRSATLKERFGNFSWRRKVLSAYEMDGPTMEQYVEVIKEYEPKLLVGYTSALYLIARFIESEGIKDVHVGSVIVTAETLFPEYRDVIEDSFNAEVFNRYGSREFSTLAHECEEHAELHMNAENLFIEVVRDGEHVVPGESGEMVVTDLHNYCMPFIRYRIEDVGVLSDEGTCSCGRGLPLLDKIEGRVHSIMTSVSGRYIPGEFFPHLFKDVKGVKQFQVIQEAKDRLLISILRDRDFSQEGMNYALDTIKRYFGEGTRVSLKFVKKIPRSKSGKFQFTISKVPIQLS